MDGDIDVYPSHFRSFSLMMFFDKPEITQCNLQFSQPFRLAEGMKRIFEPGQLADSVNVWGDISVSGRYLLDSTRTHELIFSRLGRSASTPAKPTTPDWSKMRFELNISRYKAEIGEETVQNFRFRYDPYPAELRNYRLHNDEIISLEVNRRPAFVDYIRVIAPVISTVATGFLIIDRL